jgi:DNA-binding response OmpR family regulator
MMHKILLIDDDKMVRESLAIVLEAEGYAVTMAEDGRVGLQQAKSSAPDLVLTDIIMPNMEGIELIVELRQANGTLPIIAMSGGGRTGNMDFLRCAQRLGATNVLHKPIEIDELLRAIKASLTPPAKAPPGNREQLA